MGQTWFYGTEHLLSSVPSMIRTGILTMGVSIAIMIWSVWFVQKVFGPTVLLFLFMLLYLLVGSTGQLVYSILIWLVATRINRPLTPWRKVLPVNIRSRLGKLYPYPLIAGSLIYLTGLAIAVSGLNIRRVDPENLIVIDRSFLLAGAVLFMFTFVAGFAYDIQQAIVEE